MALGSRSRRTSCSRLRRCTACATAKALTLPPSTPFLAACLTRCALCTAPVSLLHVLFSWAHDSGALLRLGCAAILKKQHHALPQACAGVDHCDVLAQMTPVDRETARMLMRNLAANLPQAAGPVRDWHGTR